VKLSTPSFNFLLKSFLEDFIAFYLKGSEYL
jgi:hypothetical protein